VNEQVPVIAPDEFVEQVVTWVPELPFHLITMLLLLTAKPLPETVTLAPTFPLVGVREMVGALTVKVAVAELVPSLTVTVLAPAGAVGTVKVQPLLMVPLALVEQELLTVAAPNFTVTPVLLAANPFPLTVTVLFTFPEVGVRVTDAALIVKVAVTLCPDVLPTA
jgi:hypothetical protein